MPRSPYLYVPMVAAVLAAFWVHALWVPLWQDDFHLLLVAREAREAGEAWWSVFWPAQKSIFWRPLSEGIYWRFIDGVLAADPVAAHAMNLLFLVAAALAVGWLVADFVPMIAPDIDPRQAFLAGAFLYGIHAAHLLPAVWVTAVHSSMVALFSALTLRFWVAALRDQPVHLSLGLLAVPLLLVLALFSKENGILVLPLSALLTALVWRRWRPTRTAWAVAAASLLLALAWLRLRQEMVVPPQGAYEMALGTNSLRNLASMALFFFNVPRESLRFMLEQQSAGAALWAVACASLQAAAIWFAVVAQPALGLKGATAVAAFFLIAGAPYLLFAWNSYAYYITLGLIVWPLVAARVPWSGKRARIALAAALLSSGLSVAGNYLLDYPALIARAEWAERQLALIREQFPSVAEEARARGVDVVVDDHHRFMAVGAAGLALALDLPRESFRVIAPDAPTGDDRLRLYVPTRGDSHFELIGP